MQVDTTDDVDRWHEWLGTHGVEVLGPVDHKIIYSIYFHDPNGVRLEITDAHFTGVERQRCRRDGQSRGMAGGQGASAPTAATSRACSTTSPPSAATSARPDVT